MTRFGLNVERVKPKEHAPEELSVTEQLLAALKERLPPDAAVSRLCATRPAS